MCFSFIILMFWQLTAFLKKHLVIFHHINKIVLYNIVSGFPSCECLFKHSDSNRRSAVMNIMCCGGVNNPSLFSVSFFLNTKKLCESLALVKTTALRQQIRKRFSYNKLSFRSGLFLLSCFWEWVKSWSDTLKENFNILGKYAYLLSARELDSMTGTTHICKCKDLNTDSSVSEVVLIKTKCVKVQRKPGK